MTAFGYASSKREAYSESSFVEEIDRLSEPFLARFKAISRSYLFFHIIFFTLGFAQLALLVLFFPFFTHSSLLAFTVAALFLTAFSYFILLFYFQEKKPTQFQELKETFIVSCRQHLPFAEGSAQRHLSIVQGIYRLLHYLQTDEVFLFSLPLQWDALHLLNKKMSYRCHAKDLIAMQELLLQGAIDEHLQLIQAAPTDLEDHTSLAQSYLFLSKIYEDSEEEEKFTRAAQKALEEFKIVASFSPDHPWVHAQMAVIYHDLDKTEQEIAAYETILALVPDDKEVIFRLGILYFGVGQNAKGLSIYESLLQKGDPHAKELIAHYGQHL